MWKKKVVEIAVLCCDTCGKELEEFPIETPDKQCGYAQCSICWEIYG